MQRKITLSILFLLLMAQGVFAQRTLRGNVKTVQNEPLIGVAVLGVNSATYKEADNNYIKGAVTDLDGFFEMEVPSEVDYLHVSLLGYSSQKVKLGPSDVLNIILEEDSKLLDEIVVVGYSTQKKQSIVGSIHQTKGDELQGIRGDLSLTNALGGVVPGISIIQTTGQPGSSGGDILIRGKSSWNSNSPLILVDGIERSFDDVDPGDVASISVLKDASATAVFGVKGANGVILINTKMGNEGHPKIKFSGNVSLKQPNATYTYLDHASAMDLYNETLFNEGVYDPDKYFSDQLIRNYRDRVNPYLYPQVDWFDEITKKVAVLQKYNVSISGGTKRVKYYTSLTYSQDGDSFKTVKNDKFDPAYRYSRINIASNVSVKATKSTTIKLQLLGVFGHTNESRVSSDALMKELTSKVPSYIFPMWYEDGKMGDYINTGRTSNPYVLLNYSGANRIRTNKIYTDLILDQKLDFITKGLSLNGKVSYNSVYTNRYGIENKFHDILNVNRYYYEPMEDGTVVEHVYPNDDYVVRDPKVYEESLSAFMRDLYYELSVRYHRTFGKHEVGALALFQRRIDFDNTSFRLPTEDWAGRLEYKYDDRYIVELSGAYNGSDRFAPGKRFGFFPAVAVGWVISNEKFFKKVDWVDEFKLRYSYGEVGTDLGAARWSYMTQFLNNGRVFFGNPADSKNVYVEGRVANVNATWETARKHNVGIELGLFDGLDLTVDLFSEKRDGMLMQRVTIPSWFGKGAPYANIGKTKSHGFEVTANYLSPTWNGFHFSIGGNVAYSDNRVVAKDDPINRDEYLKAEGKPIDTQSMLVHSGLYQDWDDIYMNAPSDWEQHLRRPGDVIYVDFNGDGKITNQDKIPYGGVTYPKFNYGINASLYYKGLNLSFLFTGASGVYRRLVEAMYFSFATNDVITAHEQSLNAWTPDNTGSDIPANRVTSNNHNSAFGAGYVNSLTYQKAGYLRLKNVELSYTFRPKDKAKAGIDQFKVYVSGKDLFTITDFDKRFDPVPLSVRSYPLMRYYSLGVELTF